MKTLFDLDAIPQKQLVQNTRQALRYYVYGEFEGRVFVYWKGHDNGGREGYFLDEYPRRKPHFWKTYAGAARFAADTNGGSKVGVWARKDSDNER